MWDEVDGVKFLLDHIKELQINLLDGIDKVDSAVSVDLLPSGLGVGDACLLCLIGCILVQEFVNPCTDLLVGLVSH